MKKQKHVHLEEPIKERPLKGLKEMMGKNAFLFKESTSSSRLSKAKLKQFKEMRKWEIELERIDREEIHIKKSLKEINTKIYETIHKRSMVKSISRTTNSDNAVEKKKINLSLNKIAHIVKQNRNNKLMLL
ncbi:hypothetical protein SteCoe_23112 [Stentor coeruleus]|uniref:Uncharacterized protein n=1 Tax=Stentor coeruleus TaxID=5963 RepID=A0A1R2BKN0_9CILI|nr:hypothetical protein SteCoe_23112 [Stentor coeruleus]